MLKSPLKSFGSGVLPLFWVYSLKLYGDKLDSFHCQLLLFLLMPMTLLLLIVHLGSCINSFKPLGLLPIYGCSIR